jgi:hypothetical protein
MRDKLKNRVINGGLALHKWILPLVLVLILTLLSILPSGIEQSHAQNPQGTTVPGSGTTTSTGSIQLQGNVTARFYALMTFELFGTTTVSPSEFLVPAVPISWMGNIFDGKLAEDGQGKDLTDQVHGSISVDGNWIENCFFSRQIIRKTSNGTGSFFRVTLKNIPLKLNEKISPGFEKTGADVQKYIQKIEYADGPLKGNQIKSTANFISVDWKNSTAGQMPVLKLVFTPGPGDRAGTSSGKKPGMMP